MPKSWSVSFDSGFSLTGGNSETTSLSLGLSAEYVWDRQARDWDRQRLSLTASFLRETNEGRETSNRGSAKLRYDFKPSAKFFLRANSLARYDGPAGLDIRFAPGASLGWELLTTARHRLSFTAGGTYIYDGFVDGTSRDDLFFDFGQEYRLQLNATTRLEERLDYAPKGRDLSDFLIHAELILSADLLQWLALKVSFIDDYDSTPFVDELGVRAEKNDVALITGLSVKL